MEIRQSDVQKQHIIDFVNRLLALEKDKKILNEDVKALKEEYKEEGVAVGIVCQVVNAMKRDKRKSEGELFEIDVIRDWLSSSTDIDDAIGDLISKV